MLSSWYSWSSQSQGNFRQKMDFPAVEKLGQTLELLGALLLPMASGASTDPALPESQTKRGRWFPTNRQLERCLTNAFLLPSALGGDLKTFPQEQRRDFLCSAAESCLSRKTEAEHRVPFLSVCRQLPPETQEKSHCLGHSELDCPKLLGVSVGRQSQPCLWRTQQT